MKGTINEAFDEEMQSEPIGIRLSALNIEDCALAIPPTENGENGKTAIESTEDSPPSTQESSEYKRHMKTGILAALHVIVGVYFGYAIYFYASVIQNRTKDDFPDDERCHAQCSMQFCSGFGMLILLVGFVYFGLFYYFVFKPKVGQKIYQKTLRPFGKWWKQFSRTKVVTIAIAAAILAGLAIYLYFETRDEPQKAAGVTAPIFFILAGFVFSTSRKDIPWRTVFTGILCQFILGLICIRWEVGRSIFQCLGDKVAIFLGFAENGSRFVFGENIVNDGVFAFAILPVIFFFSFFISMLYYLGAMQWVVLKLGWILQAILGTTVCESVTAAANIFLGMSESPLLIRPYIKLLTASEMHSIMVSGFATVSGTVLAAYMSFGASPAHLITSSVMAAPATLAISKLYMPETEVSKTTSQNMQLEKSEDTSILDAASNGASQAIPIILGIIANIVAFVAFIAFLNAIVNWLGYHIGWDFIDFEWIFSKIFIPLAWAMGVPWKDCEIVARVVATKTIVNEFVAYERLGWYMENTDLQARSAGIATFAICGFANPSSLGILIGSLSAMAPQRRNLITRVAFRAFITGSIVCFISASFAGILIPEEETERAYEKFFAARALAKNHTMIAGILPL